MLKNLAEALIKLKNEKKKGITFIEKRGDEFVPYSQLFKRASCLLFYFQFSGIESGDEVVFQINDNKTFVEVLWACFLGGYRPVPVPVAESSEGFNRLTLILKKMDKAVLVAEKKVLHNLSYYDPKIRTVCVESLSYEMESTNIYDASEDELALIQFSSGSTGSPKGVMLTHKNILSNLFAFSKALFRKTGGYTNEDSALAWIPLTHDMGLLGVHLMMICFNDNQYLIPTADFLNNPFIWINKLSEYKVTETVAPNFGFKYLVDYWDRTGIKPSSDINLSNLKVAISGGETISFDVCKSFVDTLSIYNMSNDVFVTGYGLAEATVDVSITEHKQKINCIYVKRSNLNLGEKIVQTDEDDKNAIAIVESGKPLNGIELIICDDENRNLDDLHVGQVLVRGASVTQGYYKEPELTRDLMVGDGWIKTGDIGFVNKGNLSLIGRLKDMFIVKGQNYYFSDIERVICQLDYLSMKDFALSSLPTCKGEEKLLVFITSQAIQDDFKEIEKNIRDHVLENIGIIVENIITINEIPRTASGKVQRYKLNEYYFQKEELLHSNASLSINTNEEIKAYIVEICSELIEDEVIESALNFFDLGLSSFDLTKLIERINKHFNMKLSITELFSYTTIDKLADYIYRINNKDVKF